MKTEIIFNDVIKIIPNVSRDSRGFFSESYNKAVMFDLGIKEDFIQDNHSFSKYSNTLRGLHFQIPPYAQSKLIKVLSGSIFDVFVDLRKDSETFQKFESCTLGPDDGWLYIPKGFAHGFSTLEDNTNVSYKVDNYYSKDHERGINWNDSFFSIDWPIDIEKKIISEKDSNLPIWNNTKEIIKLWS
tara:strand:- start:13370 stop:13927 length:558 start_codon:yes stop_codon:yes gene_type:complete